MNDKKKRKKQKKKKNTKSKIKKWLCDLLGS